MSPIILESPYAGDIRTNTLYAEFAMRDALRRGDAPYLSHLLYPRVLNDLIPTQRQIGIEAGYSFWRPEIPVVFYTDLGMSPGMSAAMARANARGHYIYTRTLHQDLLEDFQRSRQLRAAATSGHNGHCYECDRFMQLHDSRCAPCHARRHRATEKDLEAAMARIAELTGDKP